MPALITSWKTEFAHGIHMAIRLSTRPSAESAFPVPPRFFCHGDSLTPTLSGVGHQLEVLGGARQVERIRKGAVHSSSARSVREGGEKQGSEFAAMQILADAPLLARLGGCVLYCIMMSHYVQKAVCSAKVGWGRSILSVPAIALNLVAPLPFSLDPPEVMLRISAGFLISWLANFKILAFCFNRGLLCPQYLGKRKEWTFWQFTALLVLPMLPETDPQGANCDPNKQELTRLRQRILQFTGKLALMFIVAYVLAELNPPILLKEYLYAWSLYTFLGVWMDSTGILCSVLLEVRALDNFDQPYFATSLAQFWAKWNRVTAILLRALSFDMILDGCFVKKQVKSERKPSVVQFVLAVLAVFALSGVMHEMLFWYAAGWMAGGWFMFFLWFGPAALLEKVGREFCSRMLGIRRIPTIVGLAYVFVMMSVPALLFFSPQAEKAGAFELANRVSELVLKMHS